jgi:hypothetical protein
MHVSQIMVLCQGQGSYVEGFGFDSLSGMYISSILWLWSSKFLLNILKMVNCSALIFFFYKLIAPQEINE